MNLKEFEKKIKADQKAMDKYWWRRVYWACYRFWHNYILDAPRHTKYFFQRRIRGYDETAFWSLDYYLGNHIVKMLKIFKDKNRCGVPAPFANSHNDKDLKKGQKNWEKEIQDMIDGFNYLANDDDIEMFYWDKVYRKGDEAIKQHFKERDVRYKEAQKKASKLIKYFNSLWD